MPLGLSAWVAAFARLPWRVPALALRRVGHVSLASKAGSSVSVARVFSISEKMGSYHRILKCRYTLILRKSLIDLRPIVAYCWCLLVFACQRRRLADLVSPGAMPVYFR